MYTTVDNVYSHLEELDITIASTATVPEVVHNVSTPKWQTVLLCLQLSPSFNEWWNVQCKSMLSNISLMGNPLSAIIYLACLQCNVVGLIHVLSQHLILTLHTMVNKRYTAIRNPIKNQQCYDFYNWSMQMTAYEGLIVFP